MTAKKAAPAKKSAKKKAPPSSHNSAQLDDADLARWGRKYDKAKRQEQDGKKAKEEARDVLLPELLARGTKAIVTGGVKVTRVEPTETVYNFNKLAKKLNKKQLRRVQVEAIDKVKLAEAVEDGIIDAALVEQCTEIVDKAAYISVSVQSAR